MSKKCQTRTVFFSTSRPGWAAGHTTGLSALRHAACGRGDEARARAAERDRWRSADDHQSTQTMPSWLMGIVPEEGSTLPWAVFLSQNLRIHAVVS